jgi:3-phenylpropionate/trans-cinnamate dioxygenase ferredoxin component
MYNYIKLDQDKCEFLDVASVDELNNGERMFLEIDGIPIVVFNIGDQYFAIGDVCSHDEGPLGEGELNNFELGCPRHGATFDVRSGRVLSLPAIVDIPAYPTRVVDGQLQIGLPH